jgi:hypothetical protein
MLKKKSPLVGEDLVRSEWHVVFCFSDRFFKLLEPFFLVGLVGLAPTSPPPMGATYHLVHNPMLC